MLVPSDIALIGGEYDDFDGYAFTCPLCRRRRIRMASHRVAKVLLAVGVDVVSWTASAGPLDEAEIRAFSAALDDAGMEIWQELDRAS